MEQEAMMKKPTDSASFSETESAILEAALRNPSATNAEIAEQTDMRVALVRDIRDKYEDEVELPEDAEEADDDIDLDLDADDLSDTQLAVLEAAARDPGATNAEVAAETDMRVALVRDIRDEYEDQVEIGVTPDTDDDEDDTVDDEVELSEQQQAILDLIAANPELTNAEVAEQTGARVTLVRDTRSEHADSSFAASGEPVDDGDDTDADSDATGSGGDLHEQIQAVAADNPEMTYGEIAEEVGARVPLVRDTLSEYEYSSGGGIETADDGELPPGVDASMLTDTEQAILELAQEDSELTNAEIAAQTGTHVAIVRDTRTEHEPGKSADYGGEGTIEDEGDDDDAAGTVSATTDDDREWNPGEPSDLQTEILRLALENPELTNAEIAAETGAGIPVVRDTRGDYDELTLADLDTDTEETTELSVDAGPGEPTAVQESILSAAADSPEATNAEIADDLGVRVTLVRDTRRIYDVDDAGDTDTTGAADEESTSDTDTTSAADEGSTSDTADETAAESPDGVSMGRLVALAILVVLIVVVLLSFN
ncbi:MAG: hypothetical protein J07HN4v3_02318 [Halonotius sp. J07HN4]|nr:MAG: hypothetical protein J07HN4v3_02318 [Halonotius sp. J07HN4]